MGLIDSLFHIAPAVAGVSALVLLLQIRHIIRREHGTWTRAEARIVEVRRRASQPNDDPIDTLLREHYKMLCCYKTIDGQTISGWVGQRAISPANRGDVVPVWYATHDPQTFVLWLPEPAPWADILITLGSVVTCSALAFIVFWLVGII